MFTQKDLLRALSIALGHLSRTLAGDPPPSRFAVRKIDVRVDEDGKAWPGQAVVEIEAEHYSRPFVMGVCLEMGHVVWSR